MDETYVRSSASGIACTAQSTATVTPLPSCCAPRERDDAAARAFFERAVDLHGVLEKITIDKSGANTAAITSIHADSGLCVKMRQSK